MNVQPIGSFILGFGVCMVAAGIWHMEKNKTIQHKSPSFKKTITKNDIAYPERFGWYGEYNWEPQYAHYGK